MDIHGTPLYMDPAAMKLLFDTENIETQVTSPCASQLPAKENSMPSAVITCSRDTGAMCVENTTVCPMQKALSAAASGMPRTSPMRHWELVDKLIQAWQGKLEGRFLYLAVGVATLMDLSVT